MIFSCLWFNHNCVGKFDTMTHYNEHKGFSLLIHVPNEMIRSCAFPRMLSKKKNKGNKYPKSLTWHFFLMSQNTLKMKSQHKIDIDLCFIVEKKIRSWNCVYVVHSKWYCIVLMDRFGLSFHPPLTWGIWYGWQGKKEDLASILGNKFQTSIRIL